MKQEAFHFFLFFYTQIKYVPNKLLAEGDTSQVHNLSVQGVTKHKRER